MKKAAFMMRCLQILKSLTTAVIILITTLGFSTSNSHQAFLQKPRYPFLWERLSPPEKPQDFFPQKIASLSLASDEILFELLKKSGSLHRLAAVSSVAHDKRYSFIADDVKAQNLLQINAHIEAIVALKADWVVAASFNNPKFLQVLQRTQIPYVTLTEFKNLEDIVRHMRSLARLISHPHLAEELLKELISWEPFTKKKETLLFYDSYGYVLGSETLFDDMIKRSGFQNAVSRKGWWKISRESLLHLKPDFIIAACEKPQAVLKTLRKKVGWKHFEAVKKAKLICIPQRALYSTSFHILKAYHQLKKSYLAFSQNP